MKHLSILSAVAFAAVLFLCPQFIRAQQAAPDIQWEKSLGGSQEDASTSIQQTTDGGYIIAGQSASSDGDVTVNHGNFDEWIVKVDSGGSIQWQKSLGGSNWDEAWCIRQTSDGGYITAGESGSNDGDVTGNHGSYDYWILKLNSNGGVQWQKSLGGSGDDQALSIQQTTDRGYIVAGYSNSTDGDVTGNHGLHDYWIVKLDSNGGILWKKSLGGSREDVASSIQQTTDGGYVIAGYSYSTDGEVAGNHGASDYWIVKLDSNGNIVWKKCYGGSGDDQAYSIQQTTDGGYIVAGWSNSTDGDVSGNHGGKDYWIVKLDSVGGILWQKSCGGNSDDEARSITQTTDGGYIVSGLSSSIDGDVTGNHGSWDYWIVKLSSEGTIQWQKSLGGSMDEIAWAIRQTTDGGYIIAGESFSVDDDITGNHGSNDFWIVKLGSSAPNISSQQKQILNPLLCGLEVYDTLWVHNIGIGTLNITSAIFDKLGQGFSILSPSAFPLNISPGDSVEFTVRFAPSITGTLATTLDLYTNDTANGHNPWQINFTGQKDSVSFFVSGIVNDTLDLGIVPFNTAKDTAFTLASTSTIPTTFTLQTYDTVFTVNSLLALPLNASHTVSVHFTGENNPGRYIDSLTITDTCGRTQTVYLVATIDSILAATIQITDPINAGYVHIDSSKTVPFSIKNTGTSTITIDSMTLLGTDAQYYQLKNVPQLPFTIAAGNTQTMNITFSPINAGVHDATLDIVTSLSSTAIDIAVTGIGTRSILQAEALHFDTVAVATCKTEAMKITNAGSYPLLITNVGLRGIYAGDYTVVSVPTDTLQAGDTADIMIKYCPTTLGEEDAIAQIVTSDGDTLDVNIYGAGSGPNAVHEILPTNTSLSQNYPNPFTATTTIHVDLSPTDAKSARLNVYNVLGEEVADLSNEIRQSNDVTFTANGLQAGVYYYTLETATRQLTRQMFIIN